LQRPDPEHRHHEWSVFMTKEEERLKEHREGTANWKKWGPYLSERQWGTVREDYSGDGKGAWAYFPHEMAASRAYRRGEDGLAGISDDKQTLCFSLALWNEKDPVLKERLFGLSNPQGNHGEDVKEYYFYLDSTPTHSYMKYLYKYPQAEFPYTDLVETNRHRSREEPEYELLDTGVFDGDRYFDVFVEYAKAGPDDLLIEIRAHNRGPDEAALHLIPLLRYRNTWNGNRENRPVISGTEELRAVHPTLGEYRLHFEGAPRLLFTENETNHRKLYGTENLYPYVKDGIDQCVLTGRMDTVNPAGSGTQAAVHYQTRIAAGDSRTIRLRLTLNDPGVEESLFGEGFEHVMNARRSEADEFYRKIIPDDMGADRKNIIRQAFAGLLWTKQYYEFDLADWLRERSDAGLNAYNQEWSHMRNSDVISMPDKWEYPWYATWDLAFHVITLSQVDLDFSKEQLLLFLSDRYMRPDGQLPAYEWNFSDVNPPVHAFAVLYIHQLHQESPAGEDIDFLKTCFHKLSLNFSWWVTQKDPEGNNLFEGGFLGLDNIGVFDRSSTLPTGGRLEQSDGTAWMVLFAQFMLRIALSIARHDRSYDDEALKYLNHFIEMADVMDHPLELPDEMWDEEDGFFYDVLRYPDGTGTRLKVRSLIGLLPLCASTVIEPSTLERLPHFKARFDELVHECKGNTWGITCPTVSGVKGRRLLSALDEDKLRKVLSRLVNEHEFLSTFGIRSLSKFHEEHPYTFHWEGAEYTVAYVPGESDSGMFGGNSNWRGPVWFPMNMLLIRSLLNLYVYYGNDFTVEYPAGSGIHKNLFEIYQDISDRLGSIFERNAEGLRPVYEGSGIPQHDPNWNEYILFYEYFHGDSGRGRGASHQTGWTSLAASILQIRHLIKADDLLEHGLGLIRESVTTAPPPNG
jgi:hypothetical protein